MLSILLTTNILITIMFISMNHPLSMGFTLLIQTITVALMTGNLNQNMWFSYILFLIMVGGMLILFMYMTSIASNEKFKINTKMFMMILPASLISLLTYPYTKSLISNNETLKMNTNMEMMNTMNKYINTPLMALTLFIMIYLLLALIATVKITNFKQGSIRQMN